MAVAEWVTSRGTVRSHQVIAWPWPLMSVKPEVPMIPTISKAELATWSLTLAGSNHRPLVH